MITMIFISSVALVVGIVGSVVIWGFDAQRADEIEHTPAAPRPVGLPPGARQSRRALTEGGQRPRE